MDERETLKEKRPGVKRIRSSISEAACAALPLISPGLDSLLIQPSGVFLHGNPTVHAQHSRAIFHGDTEDPALWGCRSCNRAEIMVQAKVPVLLLLASCHTARKMLSTVSAGTETSVLASFLLRMLQN